MTKRNAGTLAQVRTEPPTNRQGSQAQAAQKSDLIVRISDATVEACCLAAVVIVPLYCPPATARLEAAKAVVLIALATVAVGAWLAGEAARRVTGVSGWAPNPLVWAGLSVFAAYAVATLFSIEPRTSIFGTFTRMQGLLTYAAYGVFFVGAASRLTRPQQIRRLITVVILGSIPAVIYGLAQQLGIDPAPSAGDPSTVQWPVRSSFGNHVFLGGYLVLVIPVTASRLAESWRQRSEPLGQSLKGMASPALVLVPLAGLSYLGFLAVANHRPALFNLMPAVLIGLPLIGIALEGLSRSDERRGASVLGYSALLLLQVVTVIVTSSRGAMWGLLAALFVLGMLAAWRFHRPKVLQAASAGVGGIVLLILLFNIPHSPLQPLRKSYVVNRIVDVRSYAVESSGSGRLLVWYGFSRLMAEHPAIDGAWGGAARDIVGYGPDSQAQTFEAVFPLKLRVETSENYAVDRAHSIYLDILVEAGLLGLLAFVATLVLFYFRLFGAVRLPAGQMALPLVGIASAVTGHLAEGVFGLETTSSLLLLWLLMGAVASPVATGDGDEDAVAPRVSSDGPAGFYGVGLVAVCGAVALFTGLTAYPRLLATLLLVGTMVGIGVVSWIVMRPPPSVARKRSKGPTPVVAPTPRSVKTLVAVISLLVAVALTLPWKYQSAAAAEAAGFSALTSGQIGQGLSNLETAAQLESRDPKYAQDLSNVYLGLAQAASPTTGQPASLGNADDWRTVDPQLAVAYTRGELIQLGLTSLRAAVSMTPLNPALHAALGDAYLRWKRYGPALQEYHRAESLSRENPRYLDDQAQVYLAMKRPQVALSEARVALRLDPTFWLTYFVLAGAYHDIHDKSQARQSATIALATVKNATPPPPLADIARIRTLRQAG